LLPTMLEHDSPSAQAPQQSWNVCRQDDNGNRFVVRRGLTREEALRLVAEYEARGHKQTYWVERVQV
jgi:UDP-N-acetyl-2-amino-2-deoxyglucuronate dehydrogenase